MSKTVKIFLASSSELEEDRRAFEQFIGRKNKTLQKEDRFLELVIWEDFVDAMSKTRLQDEYNRAARESDIFVMLFATKVGPYTREEFEAAFGQFQQTGKPLIYTYFKKVEVDPDEISEEDFASLKAFQKRLKELGHFQTRYKNSDDLINQFNHQLELRDPFADDEGAAAQPQEAVLQQYWQHLIEDPEFNSMPVVGKGERQRLENLYVRLQVTAQGDKTAVSESLQKRLAHRKGERVETKLVPDEEAWPHSLPPDAAINLFRRFVVLGPPGMGKTTMFRYIAYTVARLALGLARSDEFRLEHGDKLVALYFPLPHLRGKSHRPARRDERISAKPFPRLPGAALHARRPFGTGSLPGAARQPGRGGH